jgi:hypothetical protein
MMTIIESGDTPPAELLAGAIPYAAQEAQPPVNQGMPHYSMTRPHSSLGDKLRGVETHRKSLVDISQTVMHTDSGCKSAVNTCSSIHRSSGSFHVPAKVSA